VNTLRGWLTTPLGWFTFVLAEYLLAIGVLRAVLPSGTSAAIALPILLAVVAALFACNLWLRRRLARRDDDRDG
jgi:uncharacterized membrane protein